MKNNGNGTFTDVTDKAGVNDPRWITGASFVDYDRDGDLDLFVSNYVDFDINNLPEFGKGQTPIQIGPRAVWSKRSKGPVIHSSATTATARSPTLRSKPVWLIRTDSTAWE